MSITATLRLTALLALGAAFAVHAARGEDAKPAPGLNVGEHVPITGMRVLVGERVGAHTCLAGKNRGRRAISVYAASCEEPGLADVLKRLDDLANEEVAAYLLLTEGSSSDERLKRKVQDWAKELALKRTEVAVAGGAAKRLKLPADAAVVVVASDKRLVELRKDYKAGEIDETALAELGESLAAFSRK